MTSTTPLNGTPGDDVRPYDAANRLTQAGDVAYTWDERGNFTTDGVSTYTFNAAGRLARAESVTDTVVYTQMTKAGCGCSLELGGSFR